MAEEGSDFSDFSQPWQLSNIILEVEDVQFHVHKTILALWSSVFSTMFQSNFKEKKRHCIPLPGKTPGGGGTPIYGLYRYVPRNRVWFSRFSVLK